MTVDMLGGGIDNDVGAERQRALVQRRREHVVDDQLGTGRVRQLGDGGDIHQVEHRIRRAFQQDRLGRLRQRRLPGLQIAALHERGLDPPGR